MQAAEGVHRRTGDSTQTGLVCLVRSERIPGRTGAYLEVRVDRNFGEVTPLLFEPDRALVETNGLEMEDAVLETGPDGCVRIPVLNKASMPVSLPAGVRIGKIETLLAADNDVDNDSGVEQPTTSSPTISTIQALLSEKG